MCRDLVVHLVWGDQDPEEAKEDAGDVFNPELDYNVLTPKFEDELRTFLEDRFLGGISLEVRPLS